MFGLIYMICILLITICIDADEKFYTDTNAEDIPGLYLLNNYKKLVQLEITTSSKYLADTNDDVFITLIGEFSVSGPHNIGPMTTRGKLVNKSIYLDRIIGRLTNVIFQKRGTDAWLLSQLTCTMDGVKYDINVKQQWLSVFDQTFGELYNSNGYGNGYEPKSHEELNELPAAATLTLPVANIVKLYTSTSPISENF